MGVHNLWELLAPVGRRVSVETVAGKKLAIDASIWMIQFMKAMRNEKGEMVRNAHVLGFFRRICKLLFLRTKPVFVFDGGTPALKRRTVIARRRQRENAQAKIRKTAEKLLLNHLKTMRLKELANDLENQRLKNDIKGKRVVTENEDVAGKNSAGNGLASGSYDQEALDEMLAASLAAEEDQSFTCSASASGASVPAEDVDGEEDEEMVLPTMDGKVDPAVLAALPPSMQLDLLVQMRERLMAENRQKYQKVKKAPVRFSELQIQAYLKTVAFRREIDEVRKSAAGRGIGGVQTSRIASEANREFIFSSSFTGDKQALTSAGVERNSNEQHQMPTDPSSGSLGGVASTKKDSAPTKSVMDEPRSVIEDDVETYLDERGRVRVSRVRAMGLRMTRDLQRNLDLMKEVEQERSETDNIANNKSTFNENTASVRRKFPSRIQFLETSDQGNDGNGTVNLNNTNEELSRNRTSIEVSFEDDGEHNCAESDDDVFARLVAGDTVSVDGSLPEKQSFDADSDCEWEEGVLEGKDYNLKHDENVRGEQFLAEHSLSNECEVEWEEGSSNIPMHASTSPSECRNPFSKGALEEECDFQEAIRRSLEDLSCQKHIDISSEDEKSKDYIEMANEGTSFGSFHQDMDRTESNLSPLNKSPPEVDGVANLNDLGGGLNVSKIVDSPGPHLTSSIVVNPDSIEMLVNQPCESYGGCHPELSRQNASESKDLQKVIGHMDLANSTNQNGVNLIKEQLMDALGGGGQVPAGENSCPVITSHASDAMLVDLPDVTLSSAQQSESKDAMNEHSTEREVFGESLVKESVTDSNAIQKLASREHCGDVFKVREDGIDNSALRGGHEEQVEFTEASLEEEMQNLGRERTDLGEEQRKLERNAESVSSEMFAECQELLQMFGLPYIIAPMEAEAQCAYMELSNLVDGVVTDDSDVFLFGSRSVYKNIFDDRKYVETYFMKDIETELGLTREKLIRIALLLGSDYTEGVSGIGIVNAIEVLNAFPEEDGLQKFREWIESPDPSILGKVNLQSGSSSKNRDSKAGESCSNSNAEGVLPSNQNVSESLDDADNMKQIFMNKHRNVSKNWHIPSTFPSEAVISAYASPQVDKSTESFSWGKPDLFVLRKLCWEKFGWGTEKADELLVPVLKEYNKHETQLRLEAFYTFNEKFAKIRSKRVKKAVKGITGKKSLELIDGSLEDVSKSRKKRKVGRSGSEEDGSGKDISKRKGGAARVDADFTGKSVGKQKRTPGEPFEPGEGNSEPLTTTVGKKNTSKRSSVRGRGRGRGRGRAVDAEASSFDDNNSNSKQGVQVEKHKGFHQLRKSTRPRKAVKYALGDLEIDESDKTDTDNGHSAGKEAGEVAGKEAGRERSSGDEYIVGDAHYSGRSNYDVGDLSPKEDLGMDYIQMEGGFCMDKAEPEISAVQQNSGKNLDPVCGADSSNQYLKVGGGFCLDEDELDEDLDKCAASSPVNATIFESPDPSQHSGFVGEAAHDIDTVPFQMNSSPVMAVYEFRDGDKTNATYGGQNLDRQNATTSNDLSTVAPSQDNVMEDDSGTRPVRSLRAMPYLRRKRRKA